MSGAKSKPKSATEDVEVMSAEESALDGAFDNAKKAARNAVRADIKSDADKRALCYAVFDLIVTGMPDIVSKDSQMRSKNIGEIPQAFLAWLRKNDLPPPTFKSDNIFLPLFKNIWHSAQRDTPAYVDPFEGVTTPERPTDDAFAEMIPTAERPMAVKDIGEQAKARAADKVMTGRYARLVMAAIDTSYEIELGRNVIGFSLRWLDTAYKPWIAKEENRSLIRPLSNAGDSSEETQTDTETEDDEDDAEAVAVNPNPESTEIVLSEKAVQARVWKTLPKFKGVATFQARWNKEGVLQLKWV